MELEHIREFITLARLENFLSAADELYISQSSLSKHIKTIEAELGVLLFDRTTRKVQLSRFGKAFLPYAERMVSIQSEARNALSMLSHDTDESLRLGVLPVFTIYGIYERLADFKKTYTNCSVNLMEGSNDDLLRSLIDGRCNVVMVRHNEEGLGPQFATIPFATDHMILAVPFGHPFDDGRTAVSLKDLDNMELMSSTSEFITRTLNHLTETTGIHFNLTMRMNHSATVVTLIQRNRIPALLMRAPTEVRHEGQVRILDLDPPVTNTVSIVYLKQKPLNTAARGFIKTLFPDWKEAKLV